MGFFPSEATVNQTLLLGFPSLGGSISLLGFPQLGDLDRHFADGIFLSESTHLIYRWVTPPLQNPSKLAGTADRIPSLLGNNAASLPNHYHIKSNIPEFKDKHPEET